MCDILVSIMKLFKILFLVLLCCPLPAFPAQNQYPSGYGYVLTADKNVTVWWAEGTYKIFKEQKVPLAKSASVKISCAKNEYEPFQIILHPQENLKGVRVSVDELKNKKGGVIGKGNITINRVAYVNIETPSDAWGWKGLWPDPLPDYVEPFDAEKNENAPLWFTVYVPKDAMAGVYHSAVKISAGGMKNISVPVELKVYNFTLPDETHTKTAYGVGLSNEYHKLEILEDKRNVFDKYLTLFKTHRLSPYDPFEFYPVKRDINCETEEVSLDFKEFDAAGEKYFNGYKFNTYRVDWMDGELCGHKAFTPEYNRLHKKIYEKIAAHLKEKGWLDKAYAYWIDEPPFDAWQHVKDGMTLLHENVPSLKRLLTLNAQFPVPMLYGSVDIWCPIFFLYSKRRAEMRKKKGEEIWWYVCTAPRAPWPNNFIDHQAINHRIRFWMLQKFQVDGDLYWSTTYWAQNPWKTSMSSSSDGYMYGNGDGRLLYPPQKELPDKPVFDGPVTSIRFEMLREGLEDREYFWLLEQGIKRAREKGNEKLAKKGEGALGMIDKLVTGLTDFEKDPQKLFEARNKMAETIEEMRK